MVGDGPDGLGTRAGIARRPRCGDVREDEGVDAQVVGGGGRILARRSQSDMFSWVAFIVARLKVFIIACLRDCVLPGLDEFRSDWDIDDVDVDVDVIVDLDAVAVVEHRPWRLSGFGWACVAYNR